MIMVAVAMIPTGAYLAYTAGEERNVALSAGETVDQANLILVRDLAALGIISVLAFGGAWILSDAILVAPLAAIIDASRRLAKGDLTARSGLPPHPGEIGELATSFDEMADSIEAQQDELKKVDALKTRIIRTAAHELTAPITPIKLQLGLLKSGRAGNLGERQLKAVGVVDRNVDRLAVLVANMLDATRLQSGHFEVRPTRVDLTALVAEATNAFDEPARDAGIELVTRSTPALFVHVDGERVLQVLFNLLANAVRFTPDGGRIEVETSLSMGDALISVRDTGIGLSDAARAELFRPFGHGRDDLHDGREGAGLGLFLARGIVEQHHGKMWCESAGPGKGSTFSFTLPLDRTPARVAEVTNRI